MQTDTAYLADMAELRTRDPRWCERIPESLPIETQKAGFRDWCRFTVASNTKNAAICRQIFVPASERDAPTSLQATCLVQASSAAKGQYGPEVPDDARIRRAMAIPIHDRFQPLPGAKGLLETIHELGMRTFVTSNTYWRDADSYRDDFRALGFADLIDGIVTSIDAGHLKPHPAVFEMAMRLAGVQGDQCVVIVKGAHRIGGGQAGTCGQVH